MATLVRLGVLLALLIVPGRVNGPTVFNFHPEYIFRVLVQTGSEANLTVDYHDFVVQMGQTCDVSRPPDMNRCFMDIRDVAEQFLDIPLLEYVPVLPASVQWTAWDWDLMELKQGGYTPIVLMAELWEFNGVRAEQFYLACSVIPDQAEQSVCLVRTRFGHFNYILTSSEKIISIVDYIQSMWDG